MDALQHSLVNTATPLLLAGSAMIALGASAVVTAALLWWKRRRPDTPPAAPPRATVEAVPPVVEATPTIRSDARHLQRIDRRLDDLETQIAALADRVETVLRPRVHATPTPSAPTPEATRAPELEVVPGHAPTAEELSLRALVARAH